MASGPLKPSREQAESGYSISNERRRAQERECVCVLHCYGTVGDNNSKKTLKTFFGRQRNWQVAHSGSQNVSLVCHFQVKMFGDEVEPNICQQLMMTEADWSIIWVSSYTLQSPWEKITYGQKYVGGGTEFESFVLDFELLKLNNCIEKLNLNRLKLNLLVWIWNHMNLEIEYIGSEMKIWVFSSWIQHEFTATAVHEGKKHNFYFTTNFQFHVILTWFWL